MHGERARLRLPHAQPGCGSCLPCLPCLQRRPLATGPVAAGPVSQPLAQLMLGLPVSSARKMPARLLLRRLLRLLWGWGSEEVFTIAARGPADTRAAITRTRVAHSPALSCMPVHAQVVRASSSLSC